MFLYRKVFFFFPSRLICCSLKKICLGVVCGVGGHSSCLILSEFPGSVVFCLTLIWGKFSVIMVSSIASALFSLILQIFSLYIRERQTRTEI